MWRGHAHLQMCITPFSSTAIRNRTERNSPGRSGSENGIKTGSEPTIGGSGYEKKSPGPGPDSKKLHPCSTPLHYELSLIQYHFLFRRGELLVLIIKDKVHKYPSKTIASRCNIIRII
jgi:hypothetical protein